MTDYTDTVLTALAADPATSMFSKLEVADGFVTFAGLVPNRYGSHRARPELTISAEFLALAVRDTGLPISTCLVAFLAQAAAVRAVANEHGQEIANKAYWEQVGFEKLRARHAEALAAVRAEAEAAKGEVEAQVRKLTAQVGILEAGLRVAGAELATHRLAEQRRTDAEAATKAAAARQKALEALYTFPEAADGVRWKLRDIEGAFETARNRVGTRDLRRQTDRVRLANPRMTRQLRRFGQKISTGSGTHAYRVYFAIELVAAAVQSIRAKPGISDGMKCTVSVAQRMIEDMAAA
jgi:hypothetical protein